MSSGMYNMSSKSTTGSRLFPSSAWQCHSFWKAHLSLACSTSMQSEIPVVSSCASLHHLCRAWALRALIKRFSATRNSSCVEYRIAIRSHSARLSAVGNPRTPMQCCFARLTVFSTKRPKTADSRERLAQGVRLQRVQPLEDEARLRPDDRPAVTPVRLVLRVLRLFNTGAVGDDKAPAPPLPTHRLPAFRMKDTPLIHTTPPQLSRCVPIEGECAQNATQRNPQNACFPLGL